MEKHWRDLISKHQYGIKKEKNVPVTVRDGTRLSVNIYRPDVKGKFPALLAMGGYGKELQEVLIPPQPLMKSAVWDGNIEAGDTNDIVPRGYAHVIADVRGVGTSEGEYPGMWSQQEGMDGADIIEWIARQPWCDGNVGMIGYSYYGGIQLKIAIQQPPHLKAIFVSHISSDYYRDSVYVGGVLSLFFYGLWDGRHGTSGFAPKNAKPLSLKWMTKEEFNRRLKELLNHPDIKHYPNVYHLLNYPQKNPWFFDFLMNPFDGPFWRDKSVYPYFDKIKIPVFIVGKCAHEFSGYWDVYEGLKTTKRLYVKPGGPEERPWREDWEMIIRWYDHWLKGNDTGMMDEPPVKLFMTGANQWRYEKEWPIKKGADYKNLYLRRWEGLSFEPDYHQPEPDAYLQQPLHLSTKRDSVKYVSQPVPGDIEVIGDVAFNFFASIDQDDTNWIVKLYDVSPNGHQLRLGKGYLKASHRALDKKKSKPSKPFHKHVSADLCVPGEIYEYNVSLGTLTHVFKPGHRIKLEVESMESPRDPEMQIHYHPHLNNSKTTLHKIYRDKEHQSHITLPIVNKNQAVIDLMSDENFLGE